MQIGVRASHFVGHALELQIMRLDCSVRVRDQPSGISSKCVCVGVGANPLGVSKMMSQKMCDYDLRHKDRVESMYSYN